MTCTFLETIDRELVGERRCHQLRSGAVGFLVICLCTGCSADPPIGPDDRVIDFCDSAPFTPPEDSPYVLPYAVGSEYLMFQGNCFENGGHRNTFAYDFEMPMGTPILAGRAGRVIAANEQYSDDDHVSGHENNAFVRHADGTVIRYTHLQQGEVVVVAGDSVVTGQLLGLSGNSGASDRPHLHLQLFRSALYSGSNALPMTFRNALGDVEATGELIMGRVYGAGPS